MKNERHVSFHITVIGGGISGLSAAFRLTEIVPQATVRLIEGSGRLGGVLETSMMDGYLVEHSADSFIVTDELPDAGQLCNRLGLGPEIVDTQPENRRALILGGRRQLFPVPEGLQLMSTANLWPVLRSGLLTWKGKLRLAFEPWVRQRIESEDESLAQFATRRLGREAFDRLVQPLVAGIFTADPAQLSMQAALPQFVAMERKHGSLLRAARMRAIESPEEDQASGARYAMFRAPRNGLQQLVDRLAQKLRDANVAIDLNTRVSSIVRTNQRWEVSAGAERFATDAVIVATSASTAARILPGVSAELAKQLSYVQHASSAIACVGLRREQIGRKLDAFGAVIPHIEGRSVLAISFGSVKFPGRTPSKDHVLLRVFAGGALQPEMASLSDDATREMVMRELRELLQVSGEPQMFRVIRWIEAMPQYLMGHRDRITAIEHLAGTLPTFELAGNYFAGVGIPQCVRRAELVADRISRIAFPRSQR